MCYNLDGKRKRRTFILVLIHSTQCLLRLLFLVNFFHSLSVEKYFVQARVIHYFSRCIHSFHKVKIKFIEKKDCMYLFILIVKYFWRHVKLHLSFPVFEFFSKKGSWKIIKLKKKLYQKPTKKMKESKRSLKQKIITIQDIKNISVWKKIFFLILFFRILH